MGGASEAMHWYLKSCKFAVTVQEPGHEGDPGESLSYCFIQIASPLGFQVMETFCVCFYLSVCMSARLLY